MRPAEDLKGRSQGFFFFWERERWCRLFVAYSFLLLLYSLRFSYSSFGKRRGVDDLRLEQQPRAAACWPRMSDEQALSNFDSGSDLQLASVLE